MRIVASTSLAGYVQLSELSYWSPRWLPGPPTSPLGANSAPTETRRRRGIYYYHWQRRSTARHHQISTSVRTRPTERLVGKGSETVGGNAVVGVTSQEPLCRSPTVLKVRWFGASASASASRCLSSVGGCHFHSRSRSHSRVNVRRPATSATVAEADFAGWRFHPLTGSGLTELLFCAYALCSLFKGRGGAVRITKTLSAGTRRACTHERLRT